MKDIKKDQRAQVGALALVRITADCNQLCLFCSIPKEEYPKPYERSFEDIRREIDEVKKNDGSGVSLSGGEPTLHSKFFEIISYAKNKNIKVVEIQTNGLRFSQLSFARKTRKMGVEKSFVSFHASKKRIHDSLVGVDGSWEKCILGIKNMLDSGIQVTLNIVVNKVNYKNFPDYIKFVNAQFPKIKNISVSIIQPHGRAGKYDFLLPNYYEVDRYIKEGLSLGDKFQIEMINPYCGLPLCFGSWYERLECNMEYLEGVERLKNSNLKLISNEKKKLKSCQRCLMKKYCNGIWGKYLEKYPDFKVRPIIAKKSISKGKK